MLGAEIVSMIRVQGWILASLLAAVLGAPSWAAAQVPFDRLVVFGTSLSDTGNAFALIRQTSTPPDYSLDPFLVPSAPYARGGLHFSNGATWIEQFARRLGLARSVGPAFRSSTPWAANYAVGAARARDDGANFNLSLQVGAFLLDARGIAPPDALYVIEMGVNDVRDALIAFASGGDGGAILEAALTSIGNHITALYGAGARRFLVWNVPDPALTPSVRVLDSIVPGAALLAGNLALAFNQGLNATLTQLMLALPGLQVVTFDAHGTVNAIATNPGAFGLAMVDEACVTPNIPPFACRNPDQYLFWDGVHPTRAGHAIVARAAAAALGHYGQP